LESPYAGQSNQSVIIIIITYIYVVKYKAQLYNEKLNKMRKVSE